MKRTHEKILLTLALLALGLLATAQVAPGLFVFEAGTRIVADDVNANFQLLQNRVDDLRGEIEGSIAELQALEAQLGEFEGVPGPQGTTGERGPEGDSAYQTWLAAGNSGSESEFLAAITGPRGARGEAGPAGATGPQGPRGPQGDVGPSTYQAWLDAGNTGGEAEFVRAITGPQGPQGETGPAGPTGDQGPQGEPGPAGPSGPTGPQGIQGEAGPSGSQGLQGETGPAGPAGPAGPEGASAFEVWQAENPGGTYEQFLEAIRGPRGEQGIQGATGAPGSRGEQGPKGDPGEGVSASAVTIRTATVFVPVGDNTVRQTYDAQCEAGEIMLESGATVPANAPNFYFYWGYSDGDAPIDARTTRFAYFPTDFTPYTMTITMRCLAVAS